MSFYPKEELYCKFFEKVSPEDTHDKFMEILNTYPQAVCLDVQTCNLMDHFRDDKSGSGYGMADSYLIGRDEENKTMLFVYGGTEEVVDVTVTTNYFQGKMSLAALSIACQFILYSRIIDKAHQVGNMPLQMWATKCFYAIKDAIYLEEIGLSQADQTSFYGFID